MSSLAKMLSSGASGARASDLALPRARPTYASGPPTDDDDAATAGFARRRSS